MNNSSEQLIPLAIAARYAGVSPEHLNLLARRGKLVARKIGRNWFTTKNWLNGYFSVQKEQPAATPIDLQLALRQIEKEEKLELAKIQAELEFRRIEKEERLESAKINAYQPSQPPFAFAEEAAPLDHAAGLASEMFREEIDKIARQAEAQIAELQNEKQLMAEFFGRELDEIRNHLLSEQEQKQILLDELQKKMEEVDQSRVAEELELLRENFSQNLTLLVAEPSVVAVEELPTIQLLDLDWRREPIGASEIFFRSRNIPQMRQLMARRLIKVSVGAMFVALAAFVGINSKLPLEQFEKTLARFGTEKIFAAEVGEQMGMGLIKTADFSFLAEPLNRFYSPPTEKALAVYDLITSTPVDLSPFGEQFDRAIASFATTGEHLGRVAGATTFSKAMPWQGGASTTAPPK